MNSPLDELADLIEEEIVLGEQLREALMEHRRALCSWDVNALIASIELRRAGVRRLAHLETLRRRVFESVQEPAVRGTLKALIQTAQGEVSSKERLRVLRSRAREVFLRLKEEQRDVNDIMMAFRSHFTHALELLTKRSEIGYSPDGAAGGERAASTLICHKA